MTQLDGSIDNPLGISTPLQERLLVGPTTVGASRIATWLANIFIPLGNVTDGVWPGFGVGVGDGAGAGGGGATPVAAATVASVGFGEASENIRPKRFSGADFSVSSSS